MFLLGAYPSALHVAGTPPSPWTRVRAIPVDDEPMPFWGGSDHVERVGAWRASVSFDDAWGSVSSGMNGTSGLWVRDHVLAAFGVKSSDAWVTDCLDSYRASIGAAARIVDTYAPFAQRMKLADAALLPHPSESEIVEEALRVHRARALAELEACRPDVIVTLGNAALRVMRVIVNVGALPAKLDAKLYGATFEIRSSSVTARWHPLAHPAAPAAYQAAHAQWMKRTSS